MIRRCKFGQLEVRDEGNERALYIQGQKQGGAYFRPGADAVSDQFDPGLPGPVCSSIYALGWLVAGCQNPSASTLMIGLGSGAGAIQLLHEQPYIDLTVVDIDPVVVQAALDSYPLLTYYMDLGRLNIVVSDAKEYLINSSDEWPLGLADAYDGGQTIIDSYMPLLCERCEHVYVNCIDRLGGQSMQEITDTMRRAGKNLAQLYRATPVYAYQSDRANWILSSQSRGEQVDTYEPFTGLEGVSVENMRANWFGMVDDIQR